MSDKMYPLSFGKLMDWALTEYAQQGSLFGVFKLFRYRPEDKKLPIFREKLEAPFGPAAGPHTQLAQNILAAYAAGGRFFELKTVQKMDGEELSKCVPKPCIAAQDECYNCEWSTELTVPQAYAEYVKAWFACKLLARELELGDPEGFVFNMSVGYDLEGIQSPKVDGFIEGLRDASSSEAWRVCREWTLAHLDRFARVDEAYVQAISPKVSESITLSTLHGCPPEEIERIAAYLITQKGLHTYVKCNPTLLGYDFARQTLDRLGFGYLVFDGHHFREDLQFSDAVPMLHRLGKLAAERGVEFGVKLTNTFPVEVAAGELPSQEMYLSGRALYPLTISLAAKLAREFDGKLRISYSGGADAENIERLFAAGIWPVTMATTLLKPGGYQRLHQIAQALRNCGDQPFGGVHVAAVCAYAQDALEDGHYRKAIKPAPARKLKKQVPLLDCFTAPCQSGCPIGQDIPAYLRLAGEGRYLEALRVITQRNPLPFITGTICSHRCQDKCTRGFYEEPVHIRQVKLEAAQKGFGRLLEELAPAAPKEGLKVAVVGGGPAGLAAAYFLAREGVPVTVFEKRAQLGGIVRYVIPAFRIPEEAIERDVALCRALGVRFVLGQEIGSAQELLDQGYTDVIFATGAWRPGQLQLEYGQAVNVLDFLEACKRDPNLEIGAQVAVIGGGNTAMDAARAARRLPGVQQVRLVYRRSRRYMPADEEELELALAEGVEFCELLAPIGVRDGILTCEKMRLGAPDASGRRSPVPTGERVELPAHTVIAAVGERVDAAPYEASGIFLNAKGCPAAHPETMETNLPGVYVVGDAQHGPTVVVDAIADAAKAAERILSMAAERLASLNINPDYRSALEKKGLVCTDTLLRTDPERCLECATVCECCADVCPNRANLAIQVPGMRMRQIIHVEGLCNECGNCATFCPYDSAPYREKFTLFGSAQELAGSQNDGFLLLDAAAQRYRVRLDGREADYLVEDPACGLPEGIRALILAVSRSHAYLL